MGTVFNNLNPPLEREERERERERDRQTDRDRERQRDRETETGSQIDRQTDRETKRQIDFTFHQINQLGSTVKKWERRNRARRLMSILLVFSFAAKLRTLFFCTMPCLSSLYRQFVLDFDCSNFPGD